MTAQEWANIANRSNKQPNKSDIYFPGTKNKLSPNGFYYETPTPSPTPIQSSKQTFLNQCSYGEIYCTCLYSVLHQVDPGNESADYIAETNKNGNNAPMINAYSECNSRFGSK